MGCSTSKERTHSKRDAQARRRSPKDFAEEEEEEPSLYLTMQSRNSTSSPWQDRGLEEFRALKAQISQMQSKTDEIE